MFTRLEQAAIHQLIAERDELRARIDALEGAVLALRQAIEAKRPILGIAKKEQPKVA